MRSLSSLEPVYFTPPLLKPLISPRRVCRSLCVGALQQRTGRKAAVKVVNHAVLSREDEEALHDEVEILSNL